MNKILVIRIKGQISVPSGIIEALDRMNLKTKYSAIVLDKNEENLKILNKLRNFVSYGPVSEETISKLVEKRGKKKGKEYYPFFRLHPPRGGIESKKHYGVGKGVLGENEKIKELMERML